MIPKLEGSRDIYPYQDTHVGVRGDDSLIQSLPYYHTSSGSQMSIPENGSVSCQAPHL